LLGALFLNRQDIVLLESRLVPQANFLLLQNENHLWLVQSLLTTASAFELLEEKILRIFPLRQLASNMNLVEEQFFLKLIITSSFNCVRDLISRTRIRVSKEKARNMFGVVDEYGVLEPKQVFIQYSRMHTSKLDENSQNKYSRSDNEEIVLEGKVIITKNPCHHPGDLRIFEAVNYPRLHHLKDVVVFPQKGSELYIPIFCLVIYDCYIIIGDRPHPNEISGSDLDGDEYVVIWHEDLLPNTINHPAYDYDSQADPPKLDRPVTREDINKVVLDVSEQDCLGTMSNIHLAYVDKYGITDPYCMYLAGLISQEVDAGKTGKHPMSEEELRDCRRKLNDELPDFMRKTRTSKQYPSKRILGKLYRSACRALPGWSCAVRNYGSIRHVDVANSIQQNNKTSSIDTMATTNFEEEVKSALITLDQLLYYGEHKKYRSSVLKLFSSYRQELLEIISVYHFQDEIDLFCRCESMEKAGGGRRPDGIEDSASIEFELLIQRTKLEFYKEFDNCPACAHSHPRSCDSCYDKKLSKASTCYFICYEHAMHLPAKSKYRILSFPWLFASLLMNIRK
ncbi:unnamed protein product, partial [Didymodactylos carnosus]